MQAWLRLRQPARFEARAASEANTTRPTRRCACVRGLPRSRPAWILTVRHWQRRELLHCLLKPRCAADGAGTRGGVRLPW